MGVPYAEVIGDPIAHSKSPLIHKFWLEKLGIEGDYRATRVAAEDLHHFLLDRRRDSDWRGCNVTMPHKEGILPHMAWLDRNAELARAVNTIVRNEDGRLKGFNTDASAVTELVSSFPRPEYPNYVTTYVQIIGAGGAAKAAMIGVYRTRYGDVEFYNRTSEKAQAMAALAGLNASYGSTLDHLGPIRNPDDGPDDQAYSHVVINASSMGMLGLPDVPIDLSKYYPDTMVFDMVYHPVETGLLRQARKLGLRTVDGLQMLVAQAAHAFELLFGAKAPREHDAELRELLTR